MPRPRSDAHLRALEVWKQARDIHRQSTDIHKQSPAEPTGQIKAKRLSPEDVATRERMKEAGNAVMAGLYDEGVAAIGKLEEAAAQTGFSDSSVCNWRTTERTLPAFALLSLLEHPVAKGVVLQRLVELAGGYELREIKDPTVEELEQRRKYRSEIGDKVIAAIVDVLNSEDKNK